KNKLYEGMFLIDSSLAGSDWDGINATIRKILEKAEAEIVTIEKWDDRRLAYDIKGKSRGTYILSYFRVDGGRIQEIEKSVRLSEKIIRVLILSAERLSQADIEKETPAMKLEKGKQPESEEIAKATKAESVSPPKEVGEAEKAEDVGQTEEAKPILEEETGDVQVSDVDAVSGVSMAVEDVIEKQPEQDQIEGLEQADEKEQL
ncbi:MAG: 30S ribosomal protein S6, partial [Planctomycetota bacterium]